MRYSCVASMRTRTNASISEPSSATCLLRHWANTGPAQTPCPDRSRAVCCVPRLDMGESGGRNLLLLSRDPVMTVETRGAMYAALRHQRISTARLRRVEHRGCLYEGATLKGRPPLLQLHEGELPQNETSPNHHQPDPMPLTLMQVTVVISESGRLRSLSLAHESVSSRSHARGRVGLQVPSLWGAKLT